MAGGFNGRILWVDLSTGEMKDESLPEELYRSFFGGSGLGVRILYERMKAKADPLGPDNILGFVPGLLTGTPTPGTGRFMVVTKSPLTRCWAESNSGGTLGPELKSTGYDGIFFTGISEKPVYFELVNGTPQLRDAADLWGKDTNETDDILVERYGKPIAKVSCIGPAGETCSLISGIVNERGRIAGRVGVGAVMGSKKLKAVVVRGNKKMTVGAPDKLKEVRTAWVKSVKENGFCQGLHAFGSNGGLSFLLSIGDSTVKNWQTTGTEAMPTANQLDAANCEQYKIADYGCYACPVRCGALIKIEEGKYKTASEVHRPEYETAAALGTLCYNDNMESVIRGNEICNLYGMDTINAGAAIAFAMECYEKGLITREEAGGLDLSWGNSDTIVTLLDQMGKREGFGAVLADGVEKAVEKIGKGSEKYAMHIRGQALPYHDPRVTPCKGTSYISEANPAHHCETEGTAMLENGVPLGDAPELQPVKLEMYGDWDKKGSNFATGAKYAHIISAGGFCGLLTIQNTVPVAEFVAGATGWAIDWEEALAVGHRIATLRQAFNAREGIKPEDVKMPERFMSPSKAGVAAGVDVDFYYLRDKYFEAMGWDSVTGVPNRETIKNLGIDDLIDDLVAII